ASENGIGHVIESNRAVLRFHQPGINELEAGKSRNAGTANFANCSKICENSGQPANGLVNLLVAVDFPKPVVGDDRRRGGTGPEGAAVPANRSVIYQSEAIYGFLRGGGEGKRSSVADRELIDDAALV